MNKRKALGYVLIIVSSFFLSPVLHEGLRGELPEWGFCLTIAIILTNLALILK